jgi:zinc transporter, ZIP family
VRRVHRRRKQHGDEVTVLAGGTSAEELVEGLTIGVSAATDPSMGMIVAVAICIDNVAEGLSIGELVREKGGDRPAMRILAWTGLIGVALLVSALAGYFLLRDVSKGTLALMVAGGAGAMFYLTITQLVPEAESHQFQQSAAVASGVGLLVIFSLSNLAA